MRIFRKKKCEHDQNFRMNKYLDKDDTPMIEFDCLDCGYKDHGHVYGDAEGWVEYKQVRNGKVILHRKEGVDVIIES